MNNNTNTVLDPKFVAQVRKRIASLRRADFVEVFHSSLLQKPLPLSEQCEVDTVQAFRDAVREDIMLNGVRFVGDHRTEAFVAAVKRIVQKNVPTKKALEVSDRVMRRCSRTHSGTDSYFALQEMFGHPDLLIKPREGGTPPLDIVLGKDKKNCFKCRVRATNLYSIYYNEDIERLVQNETHSLKPLLEIDTIIIETIDFESNTTTRHLHVHTTQPPEYAFPLELRELF